METLPTDFLEDLVPPEQPDSKLVDTWLVPGSILVAWLYRSCCVPFVDRAADRSASFRTQCGGGDLRFIGRFYSLYYAYLWGTGDSFFCNQAVTPLVDVRSVTGYYSHLRVLRGYLLGKGTPGMNFF